eukprot:15089838-Alexandrium_andersonii.AAC.1
MKLPAALSGQFKRAYSASYSSDHFSERCPPEVCSICERAVPHWLPTEAQGVPRAFAVGGALFCGGGCTHARHAEEGCRLW